MKIITGIVLFTLGMNIAQFVRPQRVKYIKQNYVSILDVQEYHEKVCAKHWKRIETQRICLRGKLQEEIAYYEAVIKHTKDQDEQERISKKNR